MRESAFRNLKRSGSIEPGSSQSICEKIATEASARKPQIREIALAKSLGVSWVLTSLVVLLAYAGLISIPQPGSLGIVTLPSTTAPVPEEEGGQVGAKKAGKGKEAEDPNKGKGSIGGPANTH